MPPKHKVAARPKEPESAAAKAAKPHTSGAASNNLTRSTTAPGPSGTINERTQQRFAESRPADVAAAKVGLSGLSKAEQAAWISSRLVRSVVSSSRGSGSNKLSAKAQRDLWRTINEASLPIRTLRADGGVSGQHSSPGRHNWGRDKAGRDVGEYNPERFEARTKQRVALTALRVASRAFHEKRQRARSGTIDPLTGEPYVLCENEIDEERRRRAEMATLRAELYGERPSGSKYAQDPEWDDVEPIPLEEPEGALAAIAYPEEYAEAISYLRAVMLKKEYSPRCLRLTEHIISLNPAHYTVWLYRASIVFALKIPLPDEIQWLNQVALEHLKNYQIWHHRHLLIDNYYPTIASSPDEVAHLARSETEFLTTILVEDTKNYHVWSYRSYLVRKLGLWTPDELRSIEAMIDDDVRNNSAWSHRFFLVFSDPSQSSASSATATPPAASSETTASAGVVPGATDPDPAVPSAIINREVTYAQDKIRLAPQNQSPWNYLRGVLAKGGRPLASVEGFVRLFARNIGSPEEDVRSTHALDMLAEICAEKGDSAEAELCLVRLAEKWDRIRAGYWAWRRQLLVADGVDGVHGEGKAQK
ncbi:hypothetical protein VTK73DRAFT_2963 [Phialemonium thermophilum]|uniref:Protein farnesyltransferase/geranylgeranyltransferase type-1 subunit alpha n=1 Tax=Phialemonium thermophilum TaxID=223376 RepID=A0ABR3X1X3_9PEZI